MSYNTKNYTEPGGEKTTIGGELEIKEEARVTGLPSLSITPAAYQAPSEASDIATLRDDFNTLLSNLKATGLVESESTATDEGNEGIEEGDTEEEGGGSDEHSA